MAGAKISLSSTLGELKNDGSGNALVALPRNTAQAGYVAMFSENDPGAITGTPYLQSPETSTDFRLRVGTDSVWDSEQFHYSAQNTSKHRYTSNTLTIAWAGNVINTNGGAVTTTASGCQIQTYRHFPVLGSGAIYAETIAAISAAIPANCNIDFGAMTLAAASTSIPTDGIYFRLSSLGSFGVINTGGTEAATTLAFTPAVNQFYKFVITLTQTEIEFWIDDVLYASVNRAAGIPQQFVAASLPWAVRHHHTGVASPATSLKVGGYSVTMGDMDTNRMWSTTMSGQGLSGIQGASGMTQGQTANNVNNTVPATATLSNTAAGYTTLGGKFVFAAPLGAETDYALFAYQVTTPTTAIAGRNLVIRGVWIDTYNAVVAVATTPTVLEWSLATGSTAVTLLTADGAATRAPRRIALGVQSFIVGAAAGQQAQRVDVNLDAPLTVEPGTFVHIILRVPYGAATATELFRGQIGVNAFWE